MKVLAFVVAIMTAVAGCATVPDPALNIDRYPYRYSAFDWKIAWRTTPAARGVVVEGLMRNVRYWQVDNLDVLVRVLDPQGKVVATGVTFPVPQAVKLDESRYFDVELKDVALTDRHLLQFLIQYTATDDEMHALRWTSSFTANAATGIPLRSP